MNKNTQVTKLGLAEMLKGGLIMDVVDATQARLAEEAGACAAIAIERVPAQIRAEGGVARASDPAMIREIQRAVSIPVMAKWLHRCRRQTQRLRSSARQLRSA